MLEKFNSKMKLYKTDTIRFIAGLILIALIYTVFYVCFVENGDSKLLPRKTRHIIKFSTTIVVYFVGTFHLGKLKDSWMATLWHFIHVSGLVILSSMGFFHWYISEVNLALKQFALSIQELLMSPLLYVGMGILNKSLKK